MITQVKPTIQLQAKQIKKDITELRRQWDHLDEENYQTEKQLQISRQIGKAQEMLKKLTGETY
jgi:transcription elongation GreA/GreB family factor